MSSTCVKVLLRWPPTSVRIRTRIAASAFGLVAITAYLPVAAANEVVKWNDSAVRAVGAGGQNPIQATRTIAMVQGAVHDALNAIKPRYLSYYYEAPADSEAHPDAAIAAAARVVLLGVVPGHGSAAQKQASTAMVEESYGKAVGAISDSPAKTRGLAIGRASGEAMLLLRQNDGAGTSAPYTPSRTPGRWRPTPNPDPANPPIADAKAALGFAPSNLPGWGNVTPFALLSQAQYWLPGPPAMSSAAYARDYNEVKGLGGQVSTARTPEQEQIARFWYEGPGSWYRVTRTVAETRRFDEWDSARMLALVAMAMADSFIAGWKIRYVYDSWRPVTAIREGDTDGNDATVADPKWSSLQNTPNVSDYPSTQSVFSAAAATVITGVIGTDKVDFETASGPPFAGIKRSFTGLSQAARESADSRVYAGIHTRSACDDGLLLGRQIGQRVAAQFLLPTRR